MSSQNQVFASVTFRAAVQLSCLYLSSAFRVPHKTKSQSYDFGILSLGRFDNKRTKLNASISQFKICVTCSSARLSQEQNYLKEIASRAQAVGQGESIISVQYFLTSSISSGSLGRLVFATKALWAFEQHSSATSVQPHKYCDAVAQRS